MTICFDRVNPGESVAKNADLRCCGGAVAALSTLCHPTT